MCVCVCSLQYACARASVRPRVCTRQHVPARVGRGGQGSGRSFSPSQPLVQVQNNGIVGTQTLHPPTPPPSPLPPRHNPHSELRNSGLPCPRKRRRAGGAIRTLTLFFFYYGIHSLMFGGYPPTAIGYTPTAIGYPPTAIGYPPTAIGYTPTAIGYPPTAIGYTPTAVGYPPTAIGYPPTAIGYPPTAIGYTPMAIGYPPTAVGYPPTAIGYPPTAIGYPPTAIGYTPMAIGYPPTAIGYPPAAIVGRIGHSEFFFFSLRHPLPSCEALPAPPQEEIEACEQRDHCPTLTNRKCVVPLSADGFECGQFPLKQPNHCAHPGVPTGALTERFVGQKPELKVPPPQSGCNPVALGRWRCQTKCTKSSAYTFA